MLTPNAAFLHITVNNTIFGTAYHTLPETGKMPLVGDMSSIILGKEYEVRKFGLIYAGAQKNMAPAGLTVVIIDKSVAGREMALTPLMMSYARMIDKDSMYNTPPCWDIYILGLVLDWLEQQGGVAGMEKLKKEKALLLYNFLDESKVFKACARADSRSDMNITFNTGNEELDTAFVKGATAKGLTNLKGHRLVGGMRASVYNAQPIEGVKRLVEYMKEFEVANRV